ncbi:hypothetical protein LINPERHAP1_LOCUS19151, partial [Linum perenne]
TSLDFESPLDHQGNDNHKTSGFQFSFNRFLYTTITPYP